ncbi:carbon-nitrogen hydrolase family protein [Microbacterium aurantiacum]|uniref:Hydrolase n=1 Tax=Microbacterium aurantiacum TaxID=162393 RepID=A0A0M8MFH9_9MICO|nr:carbon-nitrogen hydrolase family protein [Microbacterium chocolatum]ANG85996.1 hydrolase [Microbacterium chocolatum]KOS10418.1 hydrolase [Microbacterium chocolatum]
MGTEDHDDVRIAVAQFAPASDEEVNLAEIAALAARASGLGADVVVFPEYSSFFIDPFDANLATHAQSLDGPFVRALCRHAAALDITIVAGLLEEASDPGLVRNTVVAVDGAGVKAVYRKVHLYDAFGQRESDWVEPGEAGGVQTFEVRGLRFGLMTCYDLRFPEVGRVLADAGVDVFAIPAEWVRGPLKELHWQTLLQARAIENTVFVAAADHPPPLGVGNSAIVDPQGVVRASIGTGTGIAVSDLERAQLERVRRINPVLSLRRYTVSPRN